MKFHFFEVIDKLVWVAAKMLRHQFGHSYVGRLLKNLLDRECPKTSRFMVSRDFIKEF